MAVAIVSDTTHYMPRDLAAEHDIHEVSLYVRFDGRQVREAEIMRDTDAFYDALRSSSEAATTSQPSIGDFLAVWEPLLRDGRDVVSIHIASGISGTYQSALQAKERLVDDGLDPARLAVIDSQRSCGGLGMILLAAAATARAGGSVEDVAERVRAAIADLEMWFAVDTLEYLRRGGRIGAAQAWLGSALKVKPILTLKDEITPIERVRTSGRAFARMTDFERTLHDSGRHSWVVQHIQAHDVAERLVECGREILGCEPLFVSEIGPVIGAHVGPGLLGVGGFPPRLLES